MDGLKPIETFYRGYRFRSRLEARWAIFFDELNIAYEYEPEGYTYQSGECYLPDFYLPKFKCFFEIKPNYTDDFEREFLFNKYFNFGIETVMKTDNVYVIAFGDPTEALPVFGSDDCDFLRMNAYCFFQNWNTEYGYSVERVFAIFPDNKKLLLFTEERARNDCIVTFNVDDYRDKKFRLDSARRDLTLVCRAQRKARYARFERLRGGIECQR